MALKECDLVQFTGTEQYYRHILLRRVCYTDGVKYVADQGGAYWLIDLIASAQLEERVRREEFQVWTLTVDGNKGQVVMDNGFGMPIYRQTIPFTDFPLPEIKMYFENSVICLPSER